MMQSSIPARCLAKMKMPIDVFLKNAIGTRTTATDIAYAIGIERSTMIRWMKKNGYPVDTKQDGQRKAIGVTIDGKTLTKKEHCQRYGFSAEYVRNVASKNKISWFDAFEVCRAKKLRRKDSVSSQVKASVCISAGVHPKSVERRMRKDRITFEQALAATVSYKEQVRSKT